MHRGYVFNRQWLSNKERLTVNHTCPMMVQVSNLVLWFQRRSTIRSITSHGSNKYVNIHQVGH